MTASGDSTHGPSQVYICETDNLHRRLSGSYRNSGPSQQTTIRVNEILRRHLTAGGTVEVAVTTSATVWRSGTEQRLDLNRNAGRRLAKNAAIVEALDAEDTTIMNMG